MEMNNKNYAKYCFIEIFWILTTALSYLSHTHTHTHIFLNVTVCMFIYILTLLLSRSDRKPLVYQKTPLSVSDCIHSHTHTLLYMHRLTFMEAPRTAVQQKSNAVSVRCMYLSGRPHTLIVK